MKKFFQHQPLNNIPYSWGFQGPGRAFSKVVRSMSCGAQMPRSESHLSRTSFVAYATTPWCSNSQWQRNVSGILQDMITCYSFSSLLYTCIYCSSVILCSVSFKFFFHLHIYDNYAILKCLIYLPHSFLLLCLYFSLHYPNPESPSQFCRLRKLIFVHISLVGHNWDNCYKEGKKSWRKLVHKQITNAVY